MIESKQINKVLAGVILVGGFTANGASNNITTVLGTALSTAGSGGVAVPLQPSISNGLGVITTGGSNRVEINQGNLKDSNNVEIYGRLTETGGVYTLTYYVLVAGTETAYTFASGTTIDFEIAYRFDLARLPSDFAVTASYRVITAAGSGNIQKHYTEALTVTATNTLSNLVKLPDATSNVTLFVNNAAYHTLGTADFTVATKTITWSPTNSGFSILVGDRVIASYTSLE